VSVAGATKSELAIPSRVAKFFAIGLRQMGVETPRLYTEGAICFEFEQLAHSVSDDVQIVMRSSPVSRFVFPNPRSAVFVAGVGVELHRRTRW